MIFIHGTFTDERLVLWAETDLAGAPGPGGGGALSAGRAGGKRGKKSPPPHPYAASVDEIVSALERANVPLVQEESRLAGFIAILPTVSGSPIPSSPIIADLPESSALPAFAPWVFDGLSLDLGEALSVLTSLDSASEDASHMVLMPDLAFCVKLVRFTGALVARGNFLPGLSAESTESAAVSKNGKNGRKRKEKGGRRGVWVPAFAGMEQERRDALIRSVPGLCRAIRHYEKGMTQDAEAQSRASFVTRTVAALTDFIVRMGEPERAAPPKKTAKKNTHREWVEQLLYHGSPPCVELDEIAAQIENWRRPIAATSSAPYRLCLQLEEPRDPGDLGGANPRNSSVQMGLFDEISADSEFSWSISYYVQPLDDPTLRVGTGDIFAADKSGAGGEGRERSESRLRLIERGGRSVRDFALHALGQAGKLYPAIGESLRASAPDRADISAGEAFRFLEEYSGALSEAGFIVSLPSWWTAKGHRKLFGVKAKAETKKSSMSAAGGMSLDGMLRVNWTAMLGDDEISLDELKRLAAMKNSIVKLRGRWVALSQEELKATLDFLKRAPKSMSARDLVGAAIGADSAAPELRDVDGNALVLDMLRKLTKAEEIEEMPVPDGLNAELRPYQRRGCSWLSFLGRWGLGACLADDMGLGKTLQTLSLLLHRKNEGEGRPALLVAPTSVLENWRREAERFVPDIRVMVHHGPSRLRGDALREDAQSHELVATSYAVLTRDAEDLSGVEWSGLIVDEAQNIKNHNTKQARSVRSIGADYRIALTGTPVENHVGDLWSIMDFLNPGLLGSETSFKRDFFTPIQKERNEVAAARLMRITGPFILRRLKTDRTIIDDLPDKIETRTFCRLKREQATLYAAVAEETERLLEGAEGIARHGLVLATMTRLKQICNHPAQYLGESAAIAAGGSENRSGKLERLYEIMDEALHESSGAKDRDRMLIFTQYAEMGGILKRCVQEKLGEEVLFLHGGVPREKRDAMIFRFQNDDDAPRVFILSIKAGGAGLNLTRANHVVLFDRWWNPAVEQQAIDRAFRIGQQKAVQVHSFVCQGTLEEKIDAMIESKRDIAGMTVGSGEAWLTNLSTDELKTMLALGETATE